MTLFPARVVGTQVAHLAESRDDGLHAICPLGKQVPLQLELVPEDDELRLHWCGACLDYLDHVAEVVRTKETVRRAVANGHAP
jgi:hypothetical protein